MPKSRIKPEYKVKLSNAVVVYINQIGDMEGKKCFLITDVAGKFDSFVMTENGAPIKDELLTRKQEIIAKELITVIAEMIAG